MLKNPFSIWSFNYFFCFKKFPISPPPQARYGFCLRLRRYRLCRRHPEGGRVICGDYSGDLGFFWFINFPHLPPPPQQGDHVLSMNCVYGGTHRYFSQVRGRRGILLEFFFYNWFYFFLSSFLANFFPHKFPSFKFVSPPRSAPPWASTSPSPISLMSRPWPAPSSLTLRLESFGLYWGRGINSR